MTGALLLALALAGATMPGVTRDGTVGRAGHTCAGEWGRATIAGVSVDHGRDAMVPRGPRTACHTTTVARTASARDTPPGGDPIDPPLPGVGGTPVPSGDRHATTVVLRRGRTMLTGRVSSTSDVCQAERRVELERGARTVASTTSKADGTFTFRRRPTVRGRRVRVTVVGRADCLAGSSRTIRG